MACRLAGAKPLSEPMLKYELFGANFCEIFIEIHAFPFKKLHLKMSSAKRWPFCLGLNVLRVLINPFKYFWNTASDTRVLVQFYKIRFQTTAPLYIPVLPRSDLTQGMSKFWSLLVAWSWISSFSMKKEYNISGTLHWQGQYIKLPIKYVLIMLSAFWSGFAILLSFTCEIMLTTLFWRIT